MLGVFAKVILGHEVKTRLQPILSRQEAEQFYLASLADSLETALRVVPAPLLFLHHPDPAAVHDLRLRLHQIGFDGWEKLQLRFQQGDDLGARLDHAFVAMGGHGPTPRPALIVGADSPSLPPRFLEDGLERLGSSSRTGTLRAEEPAADPRTRSTDQGHDVVAAIRPQDRSSGMADLVLGPAADGGFWAIGVRRPQPGLLDGVSWSTEHALTDTIARARARDLRLEMLPTWTDVDRPEDLRTLASQIEALRRSGDHVTARHSERILHRLRSTLA